MARRCRTLAFLALLAAAALPAEPPRTLTHRVWVLGAMPDEATLAKLRAAGVDGLVVPVGRVALEGGASHFSLMPLPDLAGLAGWTVTALVWVDGGARGGGDPATFAAQLAPVQRSLPGGAGLLLVARSAAPGLVGFAGRVADSLKQRVELALPAAALAAEVADGWHERVRAVAVAFGNPSALGFPPSTLQDDLSALERLDAAGVAYRVVVAVAPRSVPAPGPAGASLALLAGAETATYRPGERGDTFVLRRPVDWGGTSLASGQSVTVETVDTARYSRDLGMMLRPGRPTLEGWDTASLPAPEPALGMSLQGFLGFLSGGSPYPRPEVAIEWPAPVTMRASLVNPTDQGSAVATTGNFVELRFEGTEVRDVQLGDFSGLEYGRPDGAVWRRTVARDASALRLYLTFLAPRARVAGCTVTFLSRPRQVWSAWGLRLGDGSQVSGPLASVPLTTR